MNINSNENFLDKAIVGGIKFRIEEIVKENIEYAKKELDKKIPEIVAGVIIDFTKMTDMRILEDRIIFEIRKKY